MREKAHGNVVAESEKEKWSLEVITQPVRGEAILDASTRGEILTPWYHGPNTSSNLLKTRPP